MNEYKIGYKKPPKEHQFKPKHQTAGRPNGGEGKEDSPDVAGWLDKPLKVKRGGKSISLHPHEAMMTSLGKRALMASPARRSSFLRNARSRDCLRLSKWSRRTACSRYHEVLIPGSLK